MTVSGFGVLHVRVACFTRLCPELIVRVCEIGTKLATGEPNMRLPTKITANLRKFSEK